MPIHTRCSAACQRPAKRAMLSGCYLHAGQVSASCSHKGTARKKRRLSVRSSGCLEEIASASKVELHQPSAASSGTAAAPVMCDQLVVHASQFLARLSWPFFFFFYLCPKRINTCRRNSVPPSQLTEKKLQHFPSTHSRCTPRPVAQYPFLRATTGVTE